MVDQHVVGAQAAMGLQAQPALFQVQCYAPDKDSAWVLRFACRDNQTFNDDGLGQEENMNK